MVFAVYLLSDRQGLQEKKLCLLKLALCMAGNPGVVNFQVMRDRVFNELWLKLVVD